MNLKTMSYLFTKSMNFIRRLDRRTFYPLGLNVQIWWLNSGMEVINNKCKISV